MRIQTSKNTIGTLYDMCIKSDAEDTTSISWFASGNCMAWDSIAKSKSSQSDYKFQNMICKDRKRYTVIRAFSPLVDYKIE
jgi:hypothetical protein